MEINPSSPDKKPVSVDKQNHLLLLKSFKPNDQWEIVSVGGRFA